MKLGRKIQIIVSAVLLVAIITGGVIFVVKKNDKRYRAVIADVTTGSITQKFSTTGTVKSGNAGQFEILDGTLVKSVNVKVGDKVKKGDLLATFDTSSLSSLITDKQKVFDTAKVTYYNSITSTKDAKAQLPEIEAKIDLLEKQVAEYQAKVDAAENEQPEVEETKAPAWVDSIDYSTLSKLLGGKYTEEYLRDFFAKLANRGTSFDKISELVSNLSKLGSVGSFDMSSILGANSDETKLMSLQVELLSQKAKKTMLETQASNVLESTYKSIMETAQQSLEDTKQQVALLKKGWYASANGIVSSVNIAAGQKYVSKSGLNALSGFDLTSILSSLSGTIDINSIMSMLGSSGSNSGMTVEYYDSFVAEFSLGKYDVLDVKVGQIAKVTSLGKEFEGEVIFISPTATSSSSLDMSSILSGLTGSSSTSSIQAKLLIKDPDESVIIGTDVEIEIDVDTVSDTIVIPIESVLSDATGDYVFIFDAKEKTVKKTAVTLGLASDTGYQILSGCKVGDKIVKNQSSTINDGDEVVAIKSEDVTQV